MKEKSIYLVFTRTGTWLSNVIYLFTRDEYVHVSIAFDINFKEMYSLGRKNPKNPFSGGLVKENINEGVFKAYTSSKCLIYELKVSESQYNHIRRSLNVHYNKKDLYRYNLLGLLALYFNVSLKRENYYFCSEFVSELLINSDVYNTDKAPEHIKPMDLLEIEDKTLIYEGLINKYYPIPTESFAFR